MTARPDNAAGALAKAAELRRMWHVYKRCDLKWPHMADGHADLLRRRHAACIAAARRANRAALRRRVAANEVPARCPHCRFAYDPYASPPSIRPMANIALAVCGCGGVVADLCRLPFWYYEDRYAVFPPVLPPTPAADDWRAARRGEA